MFVLVDRSFHYAPELQACGVCCIISDTVPVPGELICTQVLAVVPEMEYMTADATITKIITHCHNVLDELFLVHQEAALQGMFDDAIELFNSYRELHDLHKSFEDEKLIPKFHEFEDQGRWPASLYTLEHDKIRDLMEKTEQYLTGLADSRLEGRNLRRNIIAFLEREKTFKGYCEHHQDREEEGLLPELDKLTDSTWRAGIISPFVEEWKNCLIRNKESISKLEKISGSKR